MLTPEDFTEYLAKENPAYQAARDGAKEKGHTLKSCPICGLEETPGHDRCPCCWYDYKYMLSNFTRFFRP